MVFLSFTISRNPFGYYEVVGKVEMDFYTPCIYLIVSNTCIQAVFDNYITCAQKLPPRFVGNMSCFVMHMRTFNLPNHYVSTTLLTC